MVNFSRIGWMIPALLGLALSGLKAESGPIRSGVAEPPKRPAEEDHPPSPKDASPQKDWMEGYYLNPQPNRLPEEVKDWSEQGLLQREGTRDVLIGFLSQVLRQNRPKIKEWDIAPFAAMLAVPEPAGLAFLALLALPRRRRV